MLNVRPVVPAYRSDNDPDHGYPSFLGGGDAAPAEGEPPGDGGDDEVGGRVVVVPEDQLVGLHELQVPVAFGLVVLERQALVDPPLCGELAHLVPAPVDEGRLGVV